MLEVRDLSVAHGHHVALDAISLDVGAGEIVAVLGANGAGKSTLLKALAGMVSYARGASIALDHADLTLLKPHQLVEAGLALVPEGRGLFADLSVRENLGLGAFPQRARPRERENLDHVLVLFPRLRERLKQVVGTMSGGEQQMVALGRALMSSPSMLMLDEPSLGLAPIVCGEVFAALTHVRAGGVSVLLVEQNVKRSLAIADRAYLIENGRVVGHGTAAMLREDAAVQRAYLGGAFAPRDVQRS